jgi:hypothetical protein
MPLGIEVFKNFIDSYVKYSAGFAHKLTIIFNGASNESEAREYHEYGKSFGVDYASQYYSSGQDIDHYFNAARTSGADLMIFLNSYSVILTTEWLEKYVASFDSNRSIGLVGSSASFQSYYSSVYQKHSWKWEAGKGIKYNFRKYKLFVKAFLYWRSLFKPFPNPHLRTNAFMLRRLDMLTLKKAKLEKKIDAYRFESGRQSMTVQIRSKGLDVLVIDKEGNLYKEDQWATSNTFWIGEQENLIVSDNQTRIYNNASAEEKKQMTRLAWGKNA